MRLASTTVQPQLRAATERILQKEVSYPDKKCFFGDITLVNIRASTTFVFFHTPIQLSFDQQNSEM